MASPMRCSTGRAPPPPLLRPRPPRRRRFRCPASSAGSASAAGAGSGAGRLSPIRGLRTSARSAASGDGRPSLMRSGRSSGRRSASPSAVLAAARAARAAAFRLRPPREPRRRFLWGAEGPSPASASGAPSDEVGFVLVLGVVSDKGGVLSERQGFSPDAVTHRPLREPKHAPLLEVLVEDLQELVGPQAARLGGEL